MIPIQPSRNLRFSGYQLTLNRQQARIFLPGHQHAQVQAQRLKSGEQTLEAVPLTRTEDGRWVSEQPLPAGAAYRFLVENQPRLDQLEVIDTKHGAFNRIPTTESAVPLKSGVIADWYQKSTPTENHLAQLDQQERLAKKQETPVPFPDRFPKIPRVNHFNQLAEGQTGSAMRQLAPKLAAAGLEGALSKPFIGGDDLSSHGYWTVDPWVLNNTFNSKEEFRQTVDAMRLAGLKMYSDGAFVNEGMNGLHVMANLAFRAQSPFWSWFRDADNPKPNGPITFPRHAWEKPEIGILPTQPDANGHPQVDHARFALRFLNDPRKEATYQPHLQTFIELYDPRLEDKEGVPRTDEAAVHAREGIRASSDSVQKYRFPIDAKELREAEGNPEKRTEWKNFRLTAPSHDDSGMKWDGQVDVALLNTQNPAVMNYIQGAVGYWSRVVMNTHTRSVAQALQAAQKALPSVKNDYGGLLNAVTRKASDPNEALKAFEALPAITDTERSLLLGHLSPEERKKTAGLLTEDEIQEAVALEQRPDINLQREGAVFSRRLLSEVPFNALELPRSLVLFKAGLSNPALEKALAAQSRQGFSGFVENKLLGPLSKLWVVGPLFSGLKHWLFPPAFQTLLGDRLQTTFNSLSETDQAKLRHGKIQSLLADQLGERIYLSLLTGLSLDKVADIQRIEAPQAREQALQNALAASLPDVILRADPVTLTQMLPSLLKKRLAKLDSHQLGKMVEKELSRLAPALVYLADAVVQKRELGLNWRIDAAKDVADTAAVRRAPDAQKGEQFDEMMQSVLAFWQPVTAAMRQSFPKAAVIAEMTDLEALAGGDIGLVKQWMSRLYNERVFDAIPAMSHLYASPLEVLHMGRSPYEFNSWQRSISRFLEENVYGNAQSMPFTALRQQQVLGSSHDFATLSHALLVNPALFHKDRLADLGLKDDFDIASSELDSKSDRQADRQTLYQAFGWTGTEAENRAKLGKITHAMRQWLDKQGRDLIPDNLTQVQGGYLARYLSKDTKKAVPNERLPELGATPFEYKGQFVDKLFALMTDPRQGRIQEASHPLHPLKSLCEIQDAQGRTVMDLSAEAVRKRFQALQTALKATMEEPSEVKAMRGALVNTVQDISDSSWRNVGVHDPAAFKAAFWQALNVTTQQVGRSWGYEALDVVLNQVFDRLTLPNALKSSVKPEAVKKLLYDTAQKPVMEKLTRYFALQTALPGMPSIYLQDFFAQGGGELTKNAFGQNRNLLRVDKLQNDAGFQAFHQQASDIFHLRKALPVLNDGVVLPITPDEQSGILPIARDNGQAQAIMLINTGKPAAFKRTALAAYNETRYPEITTTQPEVNTRAITLQSDYLNTGDAYVEVLPNGATGRRFHLNAQKQLVADDGREIRFPTQLTLKRVTA